MDKHKNKLTASEQQLKAASHQLTTSQRQLKASRQQFQSLVETSSDWIWQLDLEGKHTYSNHVIEQKLGYPADVFIEMDPTELVHPEDLGVFGETYKNAIQTKAGWDSVVLRWRCKDGEYRYFESSAKPKLDSDGELIGFIGVDRDITERKKIEEKLKVSEKKSRTLLAHSPVCTKIVDLDFNLQFMSESGRKELKIDDVTEFYGKPYPFDFDPESFRNLMTGNLEKVRETGEVIEQEASVVDIEGNKLWYHSTLVPINDDKGQIDYIMVVSIETTERKKAEETLRESEERFRTLFESAPDAIYLTDLEGNFVDGNRTSEEFIGYAKSELIGKNFAETSLLSAEQMHKTVSSLKKSAAGEPAGPDEFTLKKKDGSYITVEIRTFPVKMKDQTLVLSIARDITNRKQAEEKLRTKERVFDNSLSAISIADPEGIINEVNTAFLQAWGFSNKDEVLGRKISYFLQSEEKATEIVEKLNKAGAWKGDFIAKKKDGSTFIALGFATILHDNNGEIIGCQSSVRDITERKRAEDELKATNQQLMASEQQLRKATYEMRERIKELNCLYGLARLDEKSDSSIEQIIDELVELIPQGWQYPEIAAARITLGKYKTKTKNFRKTKWCQTADINLYGKKAGSIEVCYLKEKPLADEGPFLAQERNLIDSLASRLGQNATRKRAERILRRSEENLAQSQVMANLGSWGWNLKNDKVWWSDQMYRIFGLEPGKPKQPTFKTFLSRVHPDDREGVKSALAGIRENKEASGFEFRTVPVNGQVRTLYSHCGIEYDNENNPVRMFGTDIDITERKHTEQERERLYRSIAAKNQELQSIVFIASHDLRSPLVNIKGFAGELERSCEELTKVLKHKSITEPLKEKIEPLLKEDIPESLNFIKTGADKMELLISGLLHLSRIGTATLDVNKLNMDRMIKDILKTVRFDIQKRNAKVEVGNIPHCFGDASLVNQVFSNLIDNALKYVHPKREAVIQISGESKDGHSIYCVQDNGIGISKKHMDKVFEIFHRLNPNETDGEGLGLTIVTRTLDRLDGRIWVESERGEGSRFYVSLPAG